MREPAVTLGAAVPRVKPRRRKEVRDPYDGLRPWSAITHGIGAGLAVIGTLLLVGRSLWEGNWFHAVVFLIYGLSMICLYTASTLYHCVNTSVAKRIAPSICSSPGATPPSAPPSSGRTAESPSCR